MKKRTQIIVIVALLVAQLALHGLSQNAGAQTEVLEWFVATWGDDTNPGTALHPFRTINHALFRAGINPRVKKIIWVAEGTYAENVKFTEAGQYLCGGVTNLLRPREFRGGTSVIAAPDDTKPAVKLRYNTHIDGFTVTGGLEGITIGGQLPTSSFTCTVGNCIVKQNVEAGIAMLLQVRYKESLLRVHDCWIGENGQDGIILVNALVEITSCTVTTNVGSGIRFWSTYSVLENCVFENNGKEGIQGATEYITCLNNIVRNNGANGIYLDITTGEVTSNTITANQVDGIQCGAVLLMILDNNITQNRRNGILCRTWALSLPPEVPEPERPPRPPLCDPIIIGNYIAENNENGIAAIEESFFIAERNIIRANNESGVFATDRTTAIILDNLITENLNYGVCVTKCALPVIKDNRIVWNFRAGLRAEDNSSAIIEGNQLCWNWGEGLIIARYSTPYCSGNIITGNNGGGILCKDSARPVIANHNVVWGNLRDGVTIIDSAQPLIKQTIIANNVQNGVMISNSAQPNLLNNLIAENKKSGIVCDDMAAPIITNNIITSSTMYGLAELTETADPTLVTFNCFWQNGIADYLDEGTTEYTGADEINTLVDNEEGRCADNISVDPQFVMWGPFNRTNAIHVDANFTGTEMGTRGAPFSTITNAIISYDYRLAEGSLCIGAGKGWVDIGAYPNATSYSPQGSNEVKIIVHPGNYTESNLILNHNILLHGEDARVYGHEDFTILYPETGTTVEELHFIGGDMAIYCKPDQTPLIQRNIIEGTVFKGIFCSHADPQLLSNTLINNELHGIMLYHASPLIQDCVVEQSGGDGILCENASAPMIVHNMLVANAGAGIHCISGSSPRILSNQLKDNDRGMWFEDASDGSVQDNYIAGSGAEGILCESGSQPTIHHNIFDGNVRSGISCQTASGAQISANIIRNNIWDGIYCYNGATPEIMNNIIYGNRNCGIRLMNNLSPTVVNNTIIRNYNAGISLNLAATPTMTNNIIAFNGGYGVLELDPSSDPASLQSNCFFTNSLGDYRDEGTITYSGADEINMLVDNNGNPRGGNLSANPDLVNMSSEDFHLRADSPCVDAGVLASAPASDFEGDVRPQGPGIDIGADEIGTQWNYSFETGEENWGPGGAPIFFSTPQPIAADGVISLLSTTNTNTFGFWNSPTASIRYYANDLCCVRFRMTTDVPDSSRVPQIRLRMTAENLQQTDCLVVTSSGDGAFSPTPEGRDYDLYVVPQPGMDGEFARLAFDLLNFDPLDEPEATVSLESVTISRIPLSVLSGQESMTAYDFETGPEGWRFSGTVLPFAAPMSMVRAGALSLIATNNTNTFGFWTSDPADVTIEAGKLYRVRCSVSTDVTDPALVPQVRLRTSTQNLQASAVLDVVSAGNGMVAPAPSVKEYVAYLYPPQSAAGSAQDGLSVAFDLLNFNPADAEFATLRLHDVRIDAFDIPLMP